MTDTTQSVFRSFQCDITCHRLHLSGFCQSHAICQQGIHRIRRSQRCIPALHLLLLQQPEFHFLQHLFILLHTLNSFHSSHLRRNAITVPCVSGFRRIKITSHFRRYYRIFLNRTYQYFCLRTFSLCLQNPGNQCLLINGISSKTVFQFGDHVFFCCLVHFFSCHRIQ